MKFSDEVRKCIGDYSGFSLLITDCGGYLQGVKEILSLNDSEIELLVAKGKVRIIGENFCLGKYSDGDLSWTGKTCKTEIEKL